MGCVNAAAHQEPEVVIAGSDMSPGFPQQDAHRDKDDLTSTARTISTKAATSASSHQLVGSIDMASSWDFEGSPLAVPPGMVVRCPPTRRLHDRHVRKLTGFLSNLQKTPDVLDSMIKKRRLDLAQQAADEPCEPNSGELVHCYL